MVPTARWNLPDPGAVAEPLDGPLARFLEESGWVLTTDEWHQHPERYRGIPMPEWLEGLSRAWLVVPLISHDRLTGFVVLTRCRARGLALDWEVFDLLKTIGQQGATYLAEEDAGEALRRAQQFEAANRLSAFVLHDLKNVIGQLSLLQRNARTHGGNPAFWQNALVTLNNVIQRMNGLVAQLRGGIQSQSIQEVDLARAAREAVKGLGEGAPEPRIASPSEPVAVRTDRGRLVAVLAHVIGNAREATGANGEVRVEIFPPKEGDGPILEVIDTGEGMSPEFVRERLFQAFDTSKGEDGSGIGAFEAREFMREMGGDVEVDNTPGEGTRFRLHFPGRAVVPGDTSAVREVSG